jgi:acetyl esterase/lipase
MNVKKIVIYCLNFLFILIWIGLFGVTFWPINGLYGSEADWWSGNSADHATMYAGWGALVGMIGIIIHFSILYRRKLISLKVKRSIKIGSIIIAIILTGLCLPYFIIPIQVSTNAQTAFTNVWGPNWESRITVPSTGPWLNTPYSLIVQYSSLPYSSDMFTKTENITFLQQGNDTFMCDAFIPTGTGPFPVIIDIHGGGWVGGDKNTMMIYQEEYFAAQGYSLFSIQYGALGEAGRTHQYSMADILANIASFTDWLAEPVHFTQYKANISACFVNGLSAGGHLSAILGVARYNVSNWNPNVILKGAIDFYGITDLREWNVVSPSWFNATGLFNSSVLTDYSIVDQYSPSTYVENPALAGKEIVPLLVFHGDADTVVSVSQSREFAAMCASRDLKCVYIEIPKGSHVFEGSSNSGPTQISLWAMERFMKLCLLQ